jgi:hypothetical protein
MNVYYATIVLLAVWLVLRRFKQSRLLFGVLLLILLFVLGVTGFLSWQPELQCTRLASAVTIMSTVLITGPILLLTLTGKFHALWSVLIALVLPYPAMILALAILDSVGQMWGIGK